MGVAIWGMSGESPIVLGAGASSPGAPFSPSDLSGLQLWLKGDSLSASDGDRIATWTDSGPAGHDVTQSTAGKKPEYKTSIINSLPVVRFDSARLMNGSITLATSATVFAVCKFNASVSTYAVIASFAKYDFAKVVNDFQLSDTGVATICSYAFSTVGTAGFKLHSGTFSLSGGTVSGEMFLNAVSQATGSRSQASSGSGLQVGSAHDESIPFYGDLAELIIYDSVLGTTDRQSVEGYLNGRYAIY